MAVVDDCSVAAILAVLVSVVLVNCVLSRHQFISFKDCQQAPILLELWL
jgi:hypothetical protein